MEKKAESTINELNKKIESLQAKKDAVIKKEKERKAKAQEKWKGVFIKALIPFISKTFGEDYEDDILPERLSETLGKTLGQLKDRKDLISPKEEEPSLKDEQPALAQTSGSTS